MVSKFFASVIGAALMVSAAAAQEYPEDIYVQSEPPVRVLRGSCDRAAQHAVQMTGGELLSAFPARNGPYCTVQVLVLNAKGRPRKVRLRIPMDF